MRGIIVDFQGTLEMVGVESTTAMIVACCIVSLLAFVVFWVATATLSTGIQVIDHCFIHRTNVYVDMDGTIAQWIVGGDWQQKGYYSSLPEMSAMVEVVKCLKKNRHFRVVFLTCVVSEDAQKEKMYWLKKVFGNVSDKDVIFVPFGENKADYIVSKKTDILLDDHTPNCLSWSGKAIKVMNGINGKNGRWTGPKVYADDRPQYILRTIEKIDAA